MVKYRSFDYVFLVEYLPYSSILSGVDVHLVSRTALAASLVDVQDVVHDVPV